MGRGGGTRGLFSKAFAPTWANQQVFPPFSTYAPGPWGGPGPQAGKTVPGQNKKRGRGGSNVGEMGAKKGARTGLFRPGGGGVRNRRAASGPQAGFYLGQNFSVKRKDARLQHLGFAQTRLGNVSIQDLFRVRFCEASTHLGGRGGRGSVQASGRPFSGWPQIAVVCQLVQELCQGRGPWVQIQRAVGVRAKALSCVQPRGLGIGGH